MNHVINVDLLTCIERLGELFVNEVRLESRRQGHSDLSDKSSITARLRCDCLITLPQIFHGLVLLRIPVIIIFKARRGGHSGAWRRSCIEVVQRHSSHTSPVTRLEWRSNGCPQVDLVCI